MKYSIVRKINLGKYGLQYEALDIGVSDADSWKEAEDEIREQVVKIDTMFKEAKEKAKKKKELSEEPF